MELTKIEIESYKSIKTPVTISFVDGLPTILIGKNGSGKTNILEVLSEIALANSNRYGNREKKQPIYRAYIQLSEEDVATLLPNVVYDKDKCEVVAYNSGNGIKIDRVRSEYIVPLIKKEISDIRDLASQLKDAVDLYEKQLIKISHDGREELPIHCYNLKDANGGLMNYGMLKFHGERFINDVRKNLDHMLRTFNDDEITLTFVYEPYLYFGWDKDTSFRLEYIEPSLAKFEEKFVSINRTAIKREITKINKATKEACDNIERLIRAIEERTERIQKELSENYTSRQEQDERYHTFLSHVQHIIGKRCLFLKNDSNDVIFQKEERNHYYYNARSNPIIETYLRQVYKGSDREELLKSSKHELILSQQAVADFEAFLNENIPLFDKEMYDSISVQAGEKGHISIFLNEKTGEKINFNETSAGRRWYFTYYFMKNILSEGDIFIIDEPAAMLHPSAQREVLCDLMELTKRGVKVVYSTHSPYLIPDEWQCVHFVTMTEEGTEVNCVSSNQELVSQMTDIVGEDIFDIQIVLEKYILASPEVVARNISELIRETQKKRGIKNLQIVCDEIGIEHQAMKSWNYWPTALNGERNKKFSSPSIQNIAKVLRWAKKV